MDVKKTILSSSLYHNHIQGFLDNLSHQCMSHQHLRILGALLKEANHIIFRLSSKSASVMLVEYTAVREAKQTVGWQRLPHKEPTIVCQMLSWQIKTLNMSENKQCLTIKTALNISNY